MTHTRVACLCLLACVWSASSIVRAAPTADAPAATAPKAIAPKTAAKAETKAGAPAKDPGKGPAKAKPDAPKPSATTETPKPAPAADAGNANPASGAEVVDPTPPSSRPTAIEARVVVKVKSADDARKAILAKLAEIGGYASLITDNALDLKVPPSELPKVLNLIAAQGMVLDKTLGRTDLSLELATLNGQLKSKRTILSELRDLFDGSDISATLQIERSMTDLVKELEGVKGRLRVTTDRARWAVVHVSFDFYTEQRIKYVESQFEWLNSVQLERFLGDF